MLAIVYVIKVSTSVGYCLCYQGEYICRLLSMLYEGDDICWLLSMLSG